MHPILYTFPYNGSCLTPNYEIHTAYVLSFAGSYKLGRMNVDMVTLLHLTLNIILSSSESSNNGTYMDNDTVGVSYCCTLLTN